MMAVNIGDAEAGGFPGQQPPGDNWWLPKWASWLATAGALLLAFVAILGAALNAFTLSFFNVLAIILQLFAAIVILAIEGSSVVSFLTFAKPIGLIFEGKPLYVKTAVYAALTVFPLMCGSSSIALYLCFFISAAITALYGMILIGQKGTLDDMKAAAEQQPRI